MTLSNPLRLRYGPAEFFATFILILFALVVIFPLVLPFMFVFKTQLEYFDNPWSFPKEFRIINFVEAWKVVQIGTGLINTLIVCAGAIVATIPAAALAGYVFARYKTKATEVIFYMILAGYFVPIQMVLIPLYKFNIAVGLSNTLPGLFLPMGAFGIPFWSLIYRSFFASLPGELAEAARIDGAGHAGTFFKIMLPLAAPASYLAFLLVFIGAWSDFFLSLIMLNDQRLFTIQLRVSQFLNSYGTEKMPRYAAAAIIAAAPTVILYIIGHRWIIQGTLAGAVKE
jgi:ABC-type glycerol-3-phosphate transport system permease component